MSRHSLTRKKFAELAHIVLSLPEADWLDLLALRAPKTTAAVAEATPKRERKPKAAEAPKGE